MRYEVPQFIDIEERVIGPLTLSQFLYLAGGAGAAYIAFRYLPSVVNILTAIAVLGFGAALAFVKINNRSFPQMLFAMINYWLNPKMYIWSFDRATNKKPKKEIIEMKNENKKKLTDQKLRDLSWGLDVDTPR